MADVRHFTCDASDWSFAVARDQAEIVAVLYFRGERFGPEFRGVCEAQVQRAIARWLLLHADRAGGLH